MRVPLLSALLIVGLSSCGAQTAIPSTHTFDGALSSQSVRPDGFKNKRLFVSDEGTGNVYLYDLPSLKLVTILQGFTSPQGECADNKGDVWIADNRANIIYQLDYAGRAGAHMSDITGSPVGCAWDPTSGNLAVTNFLGIRSASGGVMIYRHAKGTPTTYTNPAQFYYNFAGYDASGNLFFDGTSPQGGFLLSELPRGGQAATTVKVTGAKISSPGMVQWDNVSKYLVVGDQDCGGTPTSCLYQLQMSGKTAAVVNKIVLENSAGTPVCDMVQGVIANGRLFGSDNDYCGSPPSALYAWPYPGGETPDNYVTKNVSKPIGAAIAVNKQTEAPRVSGPHDDLSVKKLDLLYVSESDGEVAVYTFWQKTLVRTLTGFSDPQGECVDKNNDVYITDAGNDDIVEYAHDGKQPLRTIDDSPYSPYACSVDFTTGNLAIANKTGQTSSGNIAVYAKASGTPTILFDSAVPSFEACVYDAHGSLLATNNTKEYGDSKFAWLPEGGTRLVNITIPGPVDSYDWRGVQGLQWDGLYYVIDTYDGLSRITVENGEAYYVGTTGLQEEDVFGPGWIYNTSRKKQGTQYVGLLSDDESKYDGVGYFNYPKGGDATAYIQGIALPTAVTVSLGKVHA